MGRRIHAQWPDSVVWGSVLKQWHTAANRHGERPLSRRSGSGFNADVVRRRFCGLGLLVPRHAGARRHCPRILRHCSHCLWSNPLRRAGRITATPSGSITVSDWCGQQKRPSVFGGLSLCAALAGVGQFGRANTSSPTGLLSFASFTLYSAKKAP